MSKDMMAMFLDALKGTEIIEVAMIPKNEWSQKSKIEIKCLRKSDGSLFTLEIDEPGTVGVTHKPLCLYHGYMC